MTPAVNDSIATYLITQGILGIAVLVLAVVVFQLYKKNQELNTQLVLIAQANGKELVDFYRQDAEVEAKKSDAITGMAHSIDLLTAKINRGAS